MKTQKEALLTIRDDKGELVAIVSTEDRSQIFHQVSRLPQDGIEALMNRVYDEAKV